MLAETPKPPVSAEALERARTAHDRAMATFRTERLHQVRLIAAGRRLHEAAHRAPRGLESKVRDLRTRPGRNAIITPASAAQLRRLVSTGRSRPPTWSERRRRRRGGGRTVQHQNRIGRVVAQVSSAAA